MKKHLLTFIIAFLCLNNFANAQWQGTMFPINGIIYSLFNNGTSILAGTDASFPSMVGVYLYGNSWSSTSLIPHTRITSVVGFGSAIYASGLTDAGVYFSNDNGVTWTQTFNGLPTTFLGQVLAMHSLVYGDSGVFVGSENGVYKTNNNGTNWTASGLANIDIRSLAFDGKNMYAGTYGNGVYLSTNNGNSWTAINNGLTDTIVNTIAINGNDIYAGSNKGIFISKNKGNSWSAINNGLPIVNINAITVKGSFIIAGTANQIFVSNDKGNNWAPSNTGLFSNDIFSLATKGNDVYAGANGSGVFKRSISEMTNCFAYNTTAYDSLQNNFTLSIDSLTSTIATSYHWDFGDGITSSSATPLHSYLKDSLYTVCMTVYTSSGDSCSYCHVIGKDVNGNIILGNRSVGFTLNVINFSSTGVSQNLLTDNNIQVYPNPFDLKTTINFSTMQNSTTVKLFDILGKEINIWEIKNNDKLIIEKQSMLPGLYNLKIVNGSKNVINRKIIVQ